MDRYLCVDLVKACRLLEQYEDPFKVIALLDPYEFYIDKKVKEKNVVSFSSPLDKDLFFKFMAGRKKYKIINNEYAKYYFYMGRAYALLDNYSVAVSFLKRGHKLNPMDSRITNALVGCMINDCLRCYPEKHSLIEHECKFALSNNKLSDGLIDFGNYLCRENNIEAGCCCFALSNEYKPNEYAQKSYEQCLTQYDCKSKLINSKKYREKLSSNYGFPLTFNEDVKNFIVELATSSLAKKDFYGFEYYLSKLAKMDESYKTEYENYLKAKKINLQPNPKPIKTYFNDFDIDLNPQPDICFIEYLYYELDDCKKLMDAGFSEKESKKTLANLAKFLYKTKCVSLVNTYYILKAFGHKVPKSIMNAIIKNRKNDDKINIEMNENLLSVQNYYNITREEAMVLFIYYLIDQYQSKKFSLDVVLDLVLNLGYYFDFGFFMNPDDPELGSFYLRDDDDNLYLADFDVETDRPIFKKVEMENNE